MLQATLSAKGKEGATFGYRIVKSPTSGKATIRQNGDTSILSYTAPKGYVGDTSLTLQAFDNVKTGPEVTWKIRVGAKSSTQVSALPRIGTFNPVALRLWGKSGNGTVNLSTFFVNTSNAGTPFDLANAVSLGFHSDADLLHAGSNGWSKWMSS